MTKKEFRHNCVIMGYCPSKIVTEYFKLHPKQEYTDEDYIGAYRLNNSYAGIKRTSHKKG